MRYIPFYILMVFSFVSCKENPHESGLQDGSDSTKIIELRNKIAQLELEKSQKDSVINETLLFFNEIQENLMSIGVKEDKIRIKSSDPEISQDDKEWILQEIQNINFLRRENAKHIDALKRQLNTSDLKISELQSTIEKLMAQIETQEEQINLLKNELADANMEYAQLFDEYQEQVELALDVMKEMNTVYYVYGTKEELMENDVIVKEGGFIGIGKRTNLSEDFNENYFQKLDKTKTFELIIPNDKKKMITDHPVSSYEWKNDKLLILDPDKFWRISKYLVIEVK